MAYEKYPWSGSIPAGTHRICNCGDSANKPYCDGSHAQSESGKTPILYEVTEEKKAAICQCCKSEHGPLCDGSHRG